MNLFKNREIRIHRELVIQNRLRARVNITDRTTWEIVKIAILVIIEIVVTIVRTPKKIDRRWFQQKNLGFWREN